MNCRTQDTIFSSLTLTLALAIGCFSITDGASFQQDPDDPKVTQQKANRAADQALRDAAFEGQTAEVAKAHEQGGNVNAPDQNGGTALMLASFNGHSETVAWLLEHSSEVNARDAVWRTALMYASSGPFEDTVQLLLEHGADPNAADRFENWTALMFASGEGNAGVVKILLANGADARAVDDDGDAAIDHALANRHEETVRILRDHLGTSQQESNELEL